MTSLAVAIASDARGPCSLYLMTDSRITWATAAERWDVGLKTFASPNTADIFGFCGDAYFVPIALSQALELLSRGTLDLEHASADERHLAVIGLLKAAVAQVRTVNIASLTFFHGARDGEFMDSRFRLWRSQYEVRSKVWTDEELPLAFGASYIAHADGSGKTELESQIIEVSRTAAGGTSRAAMHAFCQALHSGADPLSGGPPQLVGLWRKGPARRFGFCWHGKSYIAGMEVPNTADHRKVDWFNHLFERCDGRTGSKLKKAKSHRQSLKLTG